MSDQYVKFLALRIYRSSDSEAFETLHKLYEPKVHRFLVVKLPRTEDVYEVTNEVFLRSWEYMTSSRVDNVSGLIFRIARNLVADFYRQRKPEVAFPDGYGDHIPDTRSVERELVGKEETADLMEQLRSLKDEYRTVIVMRYVNEMAISEIAEVLEKTPNNVRVLLHRALKALRDPEQKS